ncbi:anaerobic carbon-monoxide dehydrogenase catalytic subunit [Romboutsia sedimentorum]|uniref:anaerobic carbon-monoxide dehydrogenase catalytic subunit n=1 Tax=Romboutsia sedimentorum TaxID=1368474 RepID=UPI0024DEA973|nr:anaerobic carbon-monoxide dehydrogenase catalytic subunit [Romboutsia sedimentorum]MDK2586084.1 anaerobic carbon-monoxide dehydrogenase catalytic subunit [Romboutsia sedimentorum]
MDKKLMTIDLNSRILLEKAEKDGVETMYDRKIAMKSQCGFGLQGGCCRICGMGPCRITPKTPRGLCGADVHTIVGRNFARMCAGGTAAHSDHARDIAHTMALTSREGNYKIREEDKLIELAKDWGIETEGKDIYDIAHEAADIALMEFGKPYGISIFLKNAPTKRQEIWKELGIEPRAIDREIATVMHSTHIGCCADIDSLINLSLRTSMADGWQGSMIGTKFSDIMFGTPTPQQTEANLGVLEENQVNIILHGHEPSLSEMIVLATEDPELVALAKEMGAEGINISGMCCTGNEITMRHGIKIAGDFHQQELALVTGAVEAMIVDVQCVFPALSRVADCYHTKFITTSKKAKITGSIYMEFKEENAYQDALQIVREAVLNFKNRDESRVLIPELKSSATVGYSVDAIIKQLDRVVNTEIDKQGTIKPLVDVIKSGTIRGVVGVVGCNNARVTSNLAHTTIMKELIKNDILVVTTGCGASAAAKFGLMEKSAAKKYAGKGLATVCELVDIPPVLHMGSCVDCSRILDVASAIANFVDMDISDLPLAGVAPEWMSEKAVAIGTYIVASGIDTYLGVMPPVGGSSRAVEILCGELENQVGASFTVNENPEELAALIIADIEKKRVHFEKVYEEKLCEKADA